jgi:hypothetical protein
MKRRFSPLIFQLLVFITAGCLQRSQLLVIDYLREENRVLRRKPLMGSVMARA